MKNYYYKIGLVWILVVGFSLRFYGIKERGLFQNDEGYYLLSTKTIGVGLEWVGRKIFKKEQPPLQDILLDKGGTVPSDAKPGFLALILFCSLFVGMQDYTGILVSAILGTLTIFLVFLIGKELQDKKTGLIAAFILAVSNYHIAASRSSLAHCTAIFFLCLGLFFYFYSIRSSNNKYLFISGLSIGYAFTCHYNLFVVPFLFLFFELIKKGPKNFIILSISMAIPLLIFEAIYIPIKIFIYSKGLGSILEMTAWGKFYTYFEQIVHQISLGGKAGISDSFFYIKLLIRNDGYFFIFLLCLGIISILWKRKELEGKWYLILSLFFIPLFFWSFVSSLQYERCFFIASCIFPLIAAFGLTKFVKKGWLMFLVILFILVNGIFHTRGTIKAKSGYCNAIDYMRSHKGVKHFSDIPTISRFYVGTKNVHNLHKKSFGEIKRLYNEGFNYLLLSQDRHLYSDTIFVKRANLIKPIFETPHSTTIFLYEGFDSIVRKKILLEPKVLRVYDIGEILYSQHSNSLPK